MRDPRKIIQMQNLRAQEWLSWESTCLETMISLESNTPEATGTEKDRRTLGAYWHACLIGKLQVSERLCPINKVNSAQGKASDIAMASTNMCAFVHI